MSLLFSSKIKEFKKKRFNQSKKILQAIQNIILIVLNDQRVLKISK